MVEPIYKPTTERMYSRLPEGVRVADAANDYALKRYLSVLGDVHSDIDTLVARFRYLTPDERQDQGASTTDHDVYTFDRRSFVRRWTNLVLNPSNHISGPQWVGNGASVTTSAFLGSGVRVTRTLASGTSLVSARADIRPGKTYTIRVHIRNNTNPSSTFRIALRPNRTTNAEQWVSDALTLVPGNSTHVVTLSTLAGTYTNPGVALYTATGTLNGTYDAGIAIVEGTEDPEMVWDGATYDSSELNKFKWDTNAHNGVSHRDIFVQESSVITGESSDLVDGARADTHWLPWLAQLLGADISSISAEAEVRDTLASGASGFRAGSTQAIIDAVKGELTGTKSVAVMPRMTASGPGGQWDVLIVTRATETPGFAQIADAVVRKGAKPAGVILHHRAFESSWDSIEAAIPTWDQWDQYTWDQIEEVGL